MVEGGGTIHTQLLQQGLADELHLVLSPLFVGDEKAPASSARARTSPAASACWRPAPSKTSYSCATSPPRPAPTPSPPPPTTTGSPSPATWRRTARPRRRRSASARWWWRGTARNCPGATPGRRATRWSMRRKRPWQSWTRRTRAPHGHRLHQPRTLHPPSLPPQALRPTDPRSGRPPRGHGVARAGHVRGERGRNRGAGRAGGHRGRTPGARGTSKGPEPPPAGLTTTQPVRRLRTRPLQGRSRVWGRSPAAAPAPTTTNRPNRSCAPPLPASRSQGTGDQRRR